MTNKKQEVAKKEQPKTFYDLVLSDVKNKQAQGLVLPPNYVPDNAIKSASLIISQTEDRNHKSALEVCSKQSIMQALNDMVVQGLNPMKKQCYFIVYGDKLQLMRSYFGSQVALKRLDKVEDVWANVIYKDDEFEFENVEGQDRLVKHQSCLENRDKPIIGAYAIIKEKDGKEVMTLMTMKEIEASWSQSKTSQAVHKKFPQEMAKKSVINRACKSYVNTSDDSDFLCESFNRTTENEYVQDERINEKEAIDVEVSNNANQEMFEEEPQKEEVVVNRNTGEVAKEPQPQQEPLDDDDWAL